MQGGFFVSNNLSVIKVEASVIRLAVCHYELVTFAADVLLAGIQRELQLKPKSNEDAISQATFKEAFSIYGHEARKSTKSVDAWVKELGY